MKQKIKFQLLLFVVLAALMFSCNQSSNNSKDVKPEIAKLEEISAKINLETQNIYDSIVYKLERYSDRVGDYKDIAYNVMMRKNEVVDFIQSLKIEIIRTAEGAESPAINGMEIITAKIMSLKNSKVPTQILIGENEDGKANDLKAIIKDYKSFLIEVVKNDSLISKNIELILNTDDQKKKLKGKETEEFEPWGNYTFKAQPMGSVLLTLTQLQNNVKTCESEVISFVLKEMNAKLGLNK
jgi:hypothetical protein